jgi:sulfur carrier protein
MKIFLNDQETQAEAGQTIEALLQQCEVDSSQRLAIAVNESVISRSEWSQHVLNENDRVLMIAPIQGG